MIPNSQCDNIITVLHRDPLTVLDAKGFAATDGDDTTGADDEFLGKSLIIYLSDDSQ